MIIALLDYIYYLHRKGKYNLNNDKIMRYAFIDSIPPEVLSYMKTGDAIFMFNDKSFVSWAIMYITSARMSHVMTYLESGTINHATTTGVREEPISNVFGKGRAFTVLQLNLSDKKRDELSKLSKRCINIPFGWNLIFTKFINIVLGRDKAYYRFKFALDIFIVLIILDILPYLTLHKLFFIWIIIPYLLIVGVNMLIRKYSLDTLNIPHAKPIGLYLGMRQLGAKSLLFMGEEK